MKISKIEPQKKNRNRSSVYINGNFAFGLSNEVLVRFDLHEGDEIDDDTINNILFESEKQMVRLRAFRLLRYRVRSAEELRTRLVRTGFDQEIVAAVIAELVGDKTIDDEHFARAYIADHTALKPKGNIFVRRELARLGVPADTIERAMSERDERSIVEQYLRKKLGALDLKDPKDRSKAIRRLLMRGFTPGVVYDVIGEHEK